MQPGALVGDTDDEASIRGHVGGACDVSVRAQHRVCDAVNEQLWAGGGRGVLLALHEEVATQVGVRHGLRHAAMALQTDGLEGHQGLQVNFVDGRVRLVEDEAEPGRRAVEVREQWRSESRRLLLGAGDLSFVLSDGSLTLQSSNGLLIRSIILQGMPPSQLSTPFSHVQLSIMFVDLHVCKTHSSLGK